MSGFGLSMNLPISANILGEVMEALCELAKKVATERSSWVFRDCFLAALLRSRCLLVGYAGVRMSGPQAGSDYLNPRPRL
jgi:hypothetical protein